MRRWTQDYKEFLDTLVRPENKEEVRARGRHWEAADAALSRSSRHWEAADEALSRGSGHWEAADEQRRSGLVAFSTLHSVTGHGLPGPTRAQAWALGATQGLSKGAALRRA